MGMHECFCKVPHTGTCLVFLFNGLFFGVFDMRRWWRMQRCQEYMWIWSLVDMRTWLFMHECFCKVPHTGIFLMRCGLQLHILSCNLCRLIAIDGHWLCRQ